MFSFVRKCSNGGHSKGYGDVDSPNEARRTRKGTSLARLAMTATNRAKILETQKDSIVILGIL